MMNKPDSWLQKIANNGNAYCRFMLFNCSGIQPVK